MYRRELTITGLQMLYSDDVGQNTQRLLKGVRAAAEQGADFLITPECCLSSYFAKRFEEIDYGAVAEAIDHITAAAREARVGIMLGTVFREKEGGKEYYYNQARIYTPEGEYLGFHAKILNCSRLHHPGIGNMSECVQGALRTFHWNGLCFGVLLCNDLWATPGFTTIPNPYLAWQLRRMGARVIFHMVNSGTQMRFRAYHEANVELWARALGIHIVEVNAVPDLTSPINCRSGVVAPDGEWVIEAPGIGEQIYTYTLDLAQEVDWFDDVARLGVKRKVY